MTSWGSPDYAALFDAVPSPYLLLDPDLVVVGANRAQCASLGRPREELLGRPCFDLFPLAPDAGTDGPDLATCLRTVLETGQQMTMGPRRYPVPAADGSGLEERWWSPIVVPVPGDAGAVAWLLLRFEDITGYVHRRTAAEAGAAVRAEVGAQVDEGEADVFARARELQQHNRQLWDSGRRERRQVERLEGLAKAALLVGSTLALHEVLDRIATSARELVGASWAVLSYTGAGSAAASAPALVATSPPPASPPAGDPWTPAAARSLAEVAAELVRVRPVAHLTPEEAAQHPAWAAAGEPVARGCLAAAVTGHEGAVVGLLAVAGKLDGEFDAADEALALQLAALAAVGADSAAVHQREHHVAETLQRSLLTRPPQPDHLEIAVRYAPAARHDQVGGDWYDAFVRADGSTVLVIGDVTGHDMEAAAAMGQLRNLLRATAYDRSGPPSSVLSRVDRLMDGLGLESLATVVLARIEQSARDRSRGRRRLRWSNAGHLPPVVRRADGSVEVLATDPDPLLGLVPPHPRTDHDVALHPGDTLLLYTDGLVERRDASLTDRIRALAEAVERCVPDPLDRLCDHLLQDLLPGGGEDDVALLVVRCGAEPAPQR